MVYCSVFHTNYHLSRPPVTGELFGLEGYQLHETTSVEVSNSENCYFSIWISFVEIYNETISDLLAGGATVKLKEDKHKNFFIDGMHHLQTQFVSYINPCVSHYP